TVFEVVELARGIEQRLGRDATDVEAGAAERGLAVLADEGVHARGGKSELRGADRGHVAGRAGPDDDDVVLIHCKVLRIGMVVAGGPRARGGDREATRRRSISARGPRPST